MIWCAVSEHGIAGPILFEVTVNADHYLLFLQGMDVSFEDKFLTGQGLTNTANAVLGLFSIMVFHNEVLFNQFSTYFTYGWVWPAYFPDFNKCDFFL